MRMKRARLRRDVIFTALAAALLALAPPATAQQNDAVSTELCDTGRDGKVLSLMPRHAELRVYRDANESTASVDCRLSFGDRIVIPEGVAAWVGVPHGARKHYFGLREVVYEGGDRSPLATIFEELADFFGGDQPPTSLVDAVPGGTLGAIAMPGVLPSRTQRIGSASPLFLRWQGGNPDYSVRIEKGTNPEFRGDALFDGHTSLSWMIIDTAEREPGIYQLKIADSDGETLVIQMEVVDNQHLVSAPVAIGEDAVSDFFTEGLWLLYNGGSAWRFEAISKIGLAAHSHGDPYAIELLER